MPRRQKITIDREIWFDLHKLVDQDRSTMFAVIQKNDAAYYKLITTLEQKIDRLVRENALLKNCLCDDCRVKRNMKKQVKIKQEGLQL